MNLAIDIGNTRIKCGVFDKDQLLEVKVLKDKKELNQLPKSWYSFKTAVSSVSLNQEEFNSNVQEAFVSLYSSKSTKEVADELGLEINTVNVYKKRVKKRMIQENCH